MTALARVIKRMIEAEGPMPIDRYMALCLGHPQHGYYMTRDPIGAAGDFTTAPEISQMFGELIGVWCATQWQALGSPNPFSLVELGPGRGTLMSDLLRAVRTVPGILEAAQIVMVESSPVLREAQAQAIRHDVFWHDRIDDVPHGPAIFVANEFFDAIPIRQLQRRDGRWHERRIGLDPEGGLKIGLGPATRLDGEARDFIEDAPQRSAIASEIGRRLKASPGAALIIDYGRGEPLDEPTLQAVRAHASVGILDHPGESDLTSHVDFAALSAALRGGGAATYGPMAQRDFLLAMGLEQRTDALAQIDEQARSAADRLTAPEQMGTLFNVLVAASPWLPPPYPFGAS